MDKVYDMFKANENLINHVLRKEFPKYLEIFTESEKQELLEEGHSALARAVVTFNHKRGIAESTYIYSCLKNAYINSIEKTMNRRKHIVLVKGGRDIEVKAVDEKSVEDRYVEKEGEERIYQIARESGIKELESQLRLIAKGYTVSEIETILGIPQRTQRRRLDKFRKILEKIS